AIANLNGDAFGDLVVGHPDKWLGLSDQTGRVHIFHGPPAWGPDPTPIHLRARAETARTAVVFGDDSPIDFFGEFVAAGDTTGDGLDELLVFASEARKSYLPVPGRTQFGAVYMFSGATLAGT